uniref:Uncharacterized protein n=1 Tax=Anguilla anguilla TaxID=7936 RepID=A0A0E9S9X7_ANGAN
MYVWTCRLANDFTDP